MTSRTLTAATVQPALPAKPPSRPSYVCPECGHVLRVSGLGRHRIYFELDDERLADPVMDRICPGCEHGLPGSNQRLQ